MNDCCSDNDKCRWGVGSNMPGYMPDADVAHFSAQSLGFFTHAELHGQPRGIPRTAAKYLSFSTPLASLARIWYVYTVRVSLARSTASA